MLDVPSLNTIAESLGISVGLVLIGIILITIWKLTWYGLALYKAIEKKHKAWFTILFVFTFVLNDLGIVPIVYLLLNKEKKEKKSKLVKSVVKKKSVKKKLVAKKKVVKKKRK